MNIKVMERGRENMTYIGVESILGAIFIEAIKKDIEVVPVSVVNKVCSDIQSELNSKDMNALVLNTRDRLLAIIHSEGRFEFNGYDEIRLQRGVTVGELEHRFQGYLPMEILIIIYNKVKAVISETIPVEKG